MCPKKVQIPDYWQQNDEQHQQSQQVSIILVEGLNRDMNLLVSIYCH